MADNEAPDQSISLSAGGGALKGLGEKFAPDLHTGTGNFREPGDSTAPGEIASFVPKSVLRGLEMLAVGGLSSTCVLPSRRAGVPHLTVREAADRTRSR
jgi:hypothetical protein